MRLSGIRLIPGHPDRKTTDIGLVENNRVVFRPKKEGEINEVMVVFGRMDGNSILFFQWDCPVGRNKFRECAPADIRPVFVSLQEAYEMLVAVIFHPVLASVHMAVKSSEDAVLPRVIHWTILC